MPFDEVYYQRIEDSENIPEAQLFDRLSDTDVIRLFDLFLDHLSKKYGVECPE